MKPALDLNYLDASRIFISGSDTGEFRETRDAAIVCCGLPVDQLNFAFLKLPCRDPLAAAERVREFFAGRKLACQLAFRDEGRDPAIEALEARGWRRKPEPIPGMTLALPASPAPPPKGLVVQPVGTRDELVAFRETAFIGFGYPASAARIFLPDPLLSLPQVRMYAGLVDGAVVATSMLITTGAVAGIYWVATLEAHRGRGYGEALTWAAVAGGREFGCRVASLQASKFGYPVYERMGFQHVLDYAHLLPPQSG